MTPIIRSQDKNKRGEKNPVKMLTPQLLVCVRKNVSQNLTRNLATSYVALKNASDPIQQLFLDKLSEYKSKSTGGKLVDPTPEIERELKADLSKTAKQYGGDGKEDMTKFPNFQFPEPKIEPQVSRS
ncbi:hypothetical protein M8J76_012310 [Diaphorina citri]|nr:hypothetical protein M8J76_012310 [Diaphorina citri]